MKRKLILLLLLVAAVAVVAAFYSRLFHKTQETNTLRLSGNIEAHESVVGFKVQGRIIELPVQEGQWVDAGTLVARLDGDDYRRQAEMDEATLRVQRAQLALALAGTRSQELEATQQSLNDAKADLEQKKLDYNRAETLFQQRVGSQQERDQAETNLKRAEATYRRAQQMYDEAREGTRREQLTVDRASVRQAEEKLRVSKLNVEYTVLRAPVSGVVVVRDAELGEVMAPNTPVLTIADLDHPWLRAYVNETDLGRVRWGQDVTVRTDTFPGKSYRGHISFISDKAEFTPKSVQTFKERVTLVYRIKIDVENPNHELKPGMPADATIELRPNEPKPASLGAPVAKQ
ncbi:MAG TPA: HlyD family efflux transporter periplasmic adaptor subunit [Terriglobales bacterium]|jgi:HlyD family secretion protein|nr:HlyD family efflux transporter periplasmic adaptor subunit [Terriglobales bacterium]